MEVVKQSPDSSCISTSPVQSAEQLHILHKNSKATLQQTLSDHTLKAVTGSQIVRLNRPTKDAERTLSFSHFYLDSVHLIS